MIGTSKTQTSTTTQPATKAKVEGTTYDLCKKVMVDGVEKLKKVGAVFIRASGNGGVAFVTDDDGKKYELPIFARSKRPQGPKQSAAPQAEVATSA